MEDCDTARSKELFDLGRKLSPVSDEAVESLIHRQLRTYEEALFVIDHIGSQTGPGVESVGKVRTYLEKAIREREALSGQVGDPVDGVPITGLCLRLRSLARSSTTGFEPINSIHILVAKSAAAFVKQWEQGEE